MTADGNSNPTLTISEKSAYWLVWSPRSFAMPPRYRHPSVESATTEAARLAGLFPGRHFYVLACVGFVKNGDDHIEPTTKDERLTITRSLRKQKTSESGATTATTPQGRREMDTPVSDTVTVTGNTEVARRGSTRLIRRT